MLCQSALNRRAACVFLCTSGKQTFLVSFLEMEATRFVITRDTLIRTLFETYSVLKKIIKKAKKLTIRSKLVINYDTLFALITLALFLIYSSSFVNPKFNFCNYRFEYT